jgi:hypothetical protein
MTKRLLVGGEDTYLNDLGAVRGSQFTFTYGFTTPDMASDGSISPAYCDPFWSPPGRSMMLTTAAIFIYSGAGTATANVGTLRIGLGIGDTYASLNDEFMYLSIPYTDWVYGGKPVAKWPAVGGAAGTNGGVVNGVGNGGITSYTMCQSMYGSMSYAGIAFAWAGYGGFVGTGGGPSFALAYSLSGGEGGGHGAHASGNVILSGFWF